MKKVAGIGLGELSAVERFATAAGLRFDPERLHFRGVVRLAVPGVAEVITLSSDSTVRSSAAAASMYRSAVARRPVRVAVGRATPTAVY